jgi:Type I phosphodiesterase / nucleotide pyrophosphatase
VTPGAGWSPPPYAVDLADVLPSVVASLGVADPAGRWSAPAVALPPARSAVVVLADGLGARQLARRSGHAGFLRTLQPAAPEVRSAFPSTTTSSLATFGTGLPVGQHGLTGWQVRLPGTTDRLLNHLSWKGGPDPATYQPFPTVLALAAEGGVRVATVSRPEFAGSGLTRAALEGGRFVPADGVEERIEQTVQAVRGEGPALVYLYWPEVDKVGHVHGPESWQWGQAVEELDAALRTLAARLPAGTSMTVTADHGMVEAPEWARHDLAHRPELGQGVALLGGEPRAPYVYCRPGAVADVAATWTSVLGDDAWVRTREEVVADGWFGPVRPEVLGRIGDLVVTMRGRSTLLDSRVLRPQVLALRGHHGSLTDEETLVPLLHRPA